LKLCIAFVNVFALIATKWCAITDSYSACFAVSLNLHTSSWCLSVKFSVIRLFNSSTSYDLTLSIAISNSHNALSISKRKWIKSFSEHLNQFLYLFGDYHQYNNVLTSFDYLNDNKSSQTIAKIRCSCIQ